jgi:hypothetical protein
MRTTYPVVLALALGIASIMFGLSGVSAVFDDTDQRPTGIADEVEGQADNSSVDDDGGFDADSRSEGGLIGFVIASAGTILSTAKLALTLPIALQQMGFPQWFAYPLGLATQIIAGIGFLQFVTGRIYQ